MNIIIVVYMDCKNKKVIVYLHTDAIIYFKIQLIHMPDILTRNGKKYHWVSESDEPAFANADAENIRARGQNAFVYKYQGMYRVYATKKTPPNKAKSTKKKSTQQTRVKVKAHTRKRPTIK